MIVDTEKVSREADGPEETRVRRVWLPPRWKGDRPWVRLKERTGEPTRSPKITSVECRDGLARITLEELAITHSVKDGILQNACSTKTRMVAVLGKSAHSHIVRLTHSRRNGPNRIMTKALWLY